MPRNLREPLPVRPVSAEEQARRERNYAWWRANPEDAELVRLRVAARDAIRTKDHAKLVEAAQAFVARYEATH